MKKVYWKPQAVSRTALLLIAVISIGGLLLVEQVRSTQVRPYFEEKQAAAELAAEAFEQIFNVRAATAPPIDPETDPTESGLIGLVSSDVTSVAGSLPSKQTSINPNFAAVVVDMLKEAGIKEGDVVAVGASGSFPALNICVYAALETLKLKPIIITSAAASQWGANHPDLLWIDMEEILFDNPNDNVDDEGVFSFKSHYTSIGGYEDTGQGLPDAGIEKIRASIKRNKKMLLTDEGFDASVARRMKIFEDEAKKFKKPVAAYINIGGGTVSTGRSLGKNLFKPGLNLKPPRGLSRYIPRAADGKPAEESEFINGIMPNFSRQGVPAINLVQITTLAEENGLPVAPVVMPAVGQSELIIGKVYNNYLVVGVLVVIILMLYGFIRSDVGFRILKVKTPAKEAGHPQPMV